MTCIHSTAGLCHACQSEYDEDSMAWLEYGDHPEGIRRSEELRRQMAERPSETMATDYDYPL